MNDVNQVIVVGGGLAGLSAAHTIYQNGGNVVIIDKNAFFGGNSTKATSGINGALTLPQIKHKIDDSSELFYQDTAKSARDLIRPELVKVLTYNSASAVQWLQDYFKIDLSLVSRLGGHSQPRTHRGKEKFPGMTITYALMEKLENLSNEEPNRVKILNKARVNELIKQNEEVIGVVFVKDNKKQNVYGPVILATGGYAADFTDASLLKQYRPDLYDLPTTNGDHCTGDGIKMANDIGCNLVDMTSVQVHPTGLIDPKDPNSKVKFLAAEALRGVGGILLDANGKRFVDELQHRDFVTNEMWKNKCPIRLILNSKSAKEIEWHIKHYIGRGLMKQFNSGAALAKEIGCSESTLDTTFREYNEAAKTGKDKYKKKFFSNAEFKMNDTMYASLMTPVLHFTMGGVEINDNSELLTKDKKVIKGLFGCGEICGGVHGANRLGGSSLLACVVYGRVAGDSASKYQYQKLTNSNAFNRLSNVSGHLNPNSLQTLVNFFPEQGKITLEFSLSNYFKSDLSQIQNKPTGGLSDPDSFYTSNDQSKPSPKDQKKSELIKEFSLSDIASHNKEDDCWVVVNGEVLDVTRFMHDHPGGKKAILLFAGKDATEEFNMLHKRDVVQKYAPETILGKLK